MRLLIVCLVASTLFVVPTAAMSQSMAEGEAALVAGAFDRAYATFMAIAQSNSSKDVRHRSLFLAGLAKDLAAETSGASRGERLAESQASYAAALAVVPESAAALNNLAHVVEELEGLNAALPLMKKAAAANPKAEGAFFQRNYAAMLRRAGNDTLAAQHLRKAVELDPLHEPALEELAEIHRTREHDELARLVDTLIDRQYAHAATTLIARLLDDEAFSDIHDHLTIALARAATLYLRWGESHVAVEAIARVQPGPIPRALDDLCAAVSAAPRVEPGSFWRTTETRKAALSQTLVAAAADAQRKSRDTDAERALKTARQLDRTRKDAVVALIDFYTRTGDEKQLMSVIGEGEIAAMPPRERAGVHAAVAAGLTRLGARELAANQARAAVNVAREIEYDLPMNVSRLVPTTTPAVKFQKGWSDTTAFAQLDGGFGVQTSPSKGLVVCQTAIRCASAPLENAWDVAVRGNFAFATGRKGLTIYDLTTPLTPRFVGEYPLKAETAAVAMDEQRLLAATDRGMQILDTAWPGAPRELGKLTNQEIGGAAVDIAAVPNRAYMSVRRQNGAALVVVATERSSAPSVTFTIPMTQVGRVAPFRTHVLYGDGNVLKIIDAATGQQTSEPLVVCPAGERISAIDTRPPHAAVACKSRVFVLDLSSIAAPKVLTSTSTPNVRALTIGKDDVIAIGRPE